MQAASPPPARPDGRRLWIVLALSFVALSIPYAHKALHGRGAILRWQQQILGLERGEDIAARYNYPNPPVMAVLLYPVVKLPAALEAAGLAPDKSLAAAALAWFYVKAALTLLSLAWVFRLIEEGGPPFPAWARGLAVGLGLLPIVGDLQHGNVNLFILFLVVAALNAYRRRRDLLAGGLLGLAVACKVTPALFLPYLAWKRSWRALAGAVLGLALFLWPGFVPALFVGWDNNQRQLASWYAGMVRPFVIESKVTSEHHNQSLPGLVARLATHSPSFSTYDEANRYVPTRYDNLIDLGEGPSRWLVKGCMGLFALLAAWACRTPSGVRGGWRPAAEFGVVMLGMLLFSERTWKHHCVTLVVPFAVVCYCMTACAPRAGMRAYLAASLATALLLMLSAGTGTQDGRTLSPDGLSQLFGKRAQVYGVYVLAYVVLLAALLTLLRRGDSAAAGEGTEVPGLTARRRAG
jgi:hypothetical protein